MPRGLSWRPDPLTAARVAALAARLYVPHSRVVTIAVARLAELPERERAAVLSMPLADGPRRAVYRWWASERLAAHVAEWARACERPRGDVLRLAVAWLADREQVPGAA